MSVQLSDEQRRRLHQRLAGRRGGGVPRRRGSGPVPLSATQEQIWRHELMTAGGGLYNVGRSVRLAGRLDVAALAAGLAALAARHEALRTSFAEPAGEPVQVVHPAVGVELPVVDLRRVREPEAVADRLERAAAQRPFDLARPPLLRLQLLRTAEAEHRLLVAVHHLVVDGWSLGILLEELAELYRAATARRPPRLPALPVQFADYAAWESARWADGPDDEGRRALDHWTAYLGSDLPTLDLPADRPPPERPGFRGGLVPLE